MILPHIPAVFEGGKIVLSDEYSDYKWVLITELESFEYAGRPKLHKPLRPLFGI
jgi:hypothetical protein